MEILSVKDLTFTYPGSIDCALKEVTFSVESGDFCLLAGRSGCGKTTLLRLIKPEIAPHGSKTGTIEYIPGVLIGYVGQDPDDQIVTDTVWHELAFGPENSNLDRDTICRRVSEIASFF